MDELTYEKLRDEEHDFKEIEDYEPTAREEALADIERETMDRVISEWSNN